MIHSWNYNEILMEPSRYIYGTTMIHLYNHHDTFMEPSRYIHGTIIIHSWNHHDAFMEPPWYICGTTMAGSFTSSLTQLMIMILFFITWKGPRDVEHI